MRSRLNYSLLVVSWISWTWVWAVRMIVPTVMPAVGNDLSFSANQQDALIGVFNLSTGVAFYVFGHLADRSGRKKMILAGFIASIAFTLIFSFFSSFLVLAVLAVGSGFFLGAYIPSSTAVLSDYYPQARRGFVLSIHESGAVAGQTVGSLLVGIGIIYMTWRNLVGYWALTGLIPLVLYSFFAPSRTPSQKHSDERKMKSNWTIKQNLLMVVLYTGVLAAVTGFVSIIPVYLVSTLGIALSIPAAWIGFSRLPAPIGQLGAGRLSDKYGRRPILTMITAVVTLCTMVMAYSPFNAVFIVALFVQFFAGAAFFPVILAGISDVTSLDDRSSKLGMGMAVGAIVGTGLVPIAVGVLAANFGYPIAFLLPVALSVVAVFSAAALTFRPDQFVRRPDES